MTTKQKPIDQLTPEELRVEIAESRGWTEIRKPKTFNSLFASDRHYAKSPFGLQPGINRAHPSLKSEFGMEDREPPEDWWVIIPKFTADADAALTLADALAEKGWKCRTNNGLDKTWECEFTRPPHPNSKDEHVSLTRYGTVELHYGAGDSQSLAICRAYLAVIRSEAKP